MMSCFPSLRKFPSCLCPLPTTLLSETSKASALRTSSSLLPVDEYKAKFAHMVESNTFTPGENDTTCYFYSWFNDTIYRVTPNTCQSEIALDLDGRNIPVSHYRQNFPDVLKFLESLPDGKPYGTSFYMQSDNYLMVQYMQRKQNGGTALITLKSMHPKRWTTSRKRSDTPQMTKIRC